MVEILTFSEFCLSHDLAEEGIALFRAYLAFRLGSMETDQEESQDTWDAWYKDYLMERGFDVD